MGLYGNVHYTSNTFANERLFFLILSKRKWQSMREKKKKYWHYNINSSLKHLQISLSSIVQVT